jgi:hypothetical protein
MGQQQLSEALQVSRALELLRQEAQDCEIAKLSALEMVDFRPEYLEPITERYKALTIVIRVFEDRLNDLCAEG